MYNTLCNWYNNNTATHEYILVLPTLDKLVAYFVHETDIGNIAKRDTASKKNGGKTSVRFSPDKMQVEYIKRKASKAIELISVEQFEIERQTTRQNKGQYMETVIARVTRGTLSTKSNLDFTQGGDINIGGVEYQIKTLKATFTNETTMANMIARGINPLLFYMRGAGFWEKPPRHWRADVGLENSLHESKIKIPHEPKI